MKKYFDPVRFAQVPKTYPAEGFLFDDVKAMFVENVPFQGKETRAFAWMGIPENASKENPVPGIVLVHGGLGAAFSEWVELWVKRGFAAIALDNCGGVPAWTSFPYSRKQWPRHAYSGPAGWGRFETWDQPVEDQWIYHAAATALRGKALLASMEGVDANAIGITGISWGGVISCIASGLTDFAFCASVYGCGGFDTPECSLWEQCSLEDGGQKWIELWDPDHFMTENKCPTLFLAGTGDIAFPLGRWSDSTKVPKGKVRRSLRVDYPHNHTISWSSETLYDFASAVVKNQDTPDVGTLSVVDKTVTAPYFDAGREIVSADFFYTRASGFWCDRKWNRRDVVIENGCLKADLPFGATCGFFVLNDGNKCKWSSDILQF